VTSAQPGDRRDRLIDTAIRLFSERSYAGVSVQEIADDAGVATGLLYYHFKDKQGLYVAGMEVFVQRLRAAIEAAAQASLAPIERLIAGLSAQLHFIEKHPDGYRELLRGAASLPPVSAIIEREREERLNQIVEGLPLGVTPTPTVMATLEGWLHFVDGIQLAWLEGNTLKREQIADLCQRVLLASITTVAQYDRERQSSDEPS